MFLLLRIQHAAEDIGIHRARNTLALGEALVSEQRRPVLCHLRVQFPKHWKVIAADVMPRTGTVVVVDIFYTVNYSAVTLHTGQLYLIEEELKACLPRVVRDDTVDLADLVQQAVGFGIKE